MTWWSYKIEYQCRIWQAVPHFFNLIFKISIKIYRENKPRPLRSCFLRIMTAWSILVECHQRKISVTLYYIRSSAMIAEKKKDFYSSFIPRHTIVAGYYGFTLDVRVSVRPPYVRPSVFRFRMITWVNFNGFSPNLVCALILWRSGLWLLMGKFRQIFTELSARDTPIFSFPDDNLSKWQWILTKLAIYIGIKEIWFGIANGQMWSSFYSYLPETLP